MPFIIYPKSRNALTRQELLLFSRRSKGLCSKSLDHSLETRNTSFILPSVIDACPA